MGFTGATTVEFIERGTTLEQTASFAVVSDTQMTVTVPNLGTANRACYILLVTNSSSTVTLDGSATIVHSGTSVSLQKAGIAVYVNADGKVSNTNAGCAYFVKSSGTASTASAGNLVYAESGATVTGSSPVVTVPSLSESAVTTAFQYFYSAPPPVVTTGTVSNAGITIATLNGTVNPEGNAAQAYFQYGTTLSYGSVTASQNLAANSTAIGVTGTLAGLLPGTLYHYSLVATNTSGTFAGTDVTFMTEGSAGVTPVIANAAAGEVTFDSAVLNALVDPNGSATSVTFQYGLSGTYGFATTPQAIGSGSNQLFVTGPLAGLAPNTVYHYCVVATSTNGMSASADQTFQTGAVGITGYSPSRAGPGTTITLNGIGFTGATSVLLANETVAESGTASFVVLSDTQMTVTVPNFFSFVGSYYITVVTSAGVTVTVDPATTDVQNGATLTSESGNTEVVYVEPGGAVTGAQGVNSVNYYVKNGGAVSAGFNAKLIYAEPGAGVNTGTDTVVTVPQISQSPVSTLFQFLAATPAVNTGLATNVDFGDATLNGTVDPNEISTSLYFEYGTTTSYGSQTPTVAVSGSQTLPESAQLTELAPGTLYHYQLVTVNVSGTSYGGDVTFTTASIAGGVPGLITGSAGGIAYSAATLKATVNPDGEATNVYFEYGLSGSYGSTTPTQAIGDGVYNVLVEAPLTNLLPNTTYHYCVVATNTNGTVTGPDETLQTGAVLITGLSPAKGLAGATLTLTGSGFTGTTNVTFLKEVWPGSYSANFLVLSDTEMTVTVPNLLGPSNNCYINVSNTSGMTMTLSSTTTIVESGSTLGFGTPSSKAIYVDSGGRVTGVSGGFEVNFYVKNGGILGSGSGSNICYVEPGGIVETGSAVVVTVPLMSQSFVPALFDFLTPSKVTTGICTGTSISNAITSGTVNPEGTNTTVYFQYGAGTANQGNVAINTSLGPIYTNQTPPQLLGSGTMDTPVAASLTGLTEGTVYHYQLVATNDAGSSYGADQTLATPPGPYNNWSSIQFPAGDQGNAAITGPNATPAGDGVPNLLKYALGLNPMTTATSGLPVEAAAVVNGTNCVTFTYPKIDAETDITYNPEWSVDLVTWSNAGLTQTVLSDNGTSQQVQVSVPKTGNQSIFFQLNVTMP